MAGAAGRRGGAAAVYAAQRSLLHGLGIAPGGTAAGLRGALFFLWDQLDLLLGYRIVFGTLIEPTALRLAVSVAAVAGLHPLLTLIGYLLGMRPTAR